MLGSAYLGVHSMDVQGVDTNCGAVNAGGQDEIARVDLFLLMSEKEMLRATLNQVVQATREVATCNSTVKNSAQRELVKHLSALAVLLDSNILQLDGLNLIMSEFYGLMRADLQMNMTSTASVQQFDTLISIFTRAAGFAFSITNRSILLDIVKTEAVTQARLNFIDSAGQLAARAVRLTWLRNQYSRQNDMAEDKDDYQYAPRSLSTSLDQDFIMISEKDVRKVVLVLKISETQARFYLHYHDGADAFIAAFQVQSDASKRRAVIQSASSSDTVSVSNDGDDDDNESMGTACEDDDDDDIEGTVDEDLVVFKRLIRDGKALKESGIDVRAVRSVDPTGIEVDDQLIYNVTGEVVTIVEKHESWGQHFFKVLSKRDGPFYAISYNLAVAVDDAEYAGKESFKVYSESDATAENDFPVLTKKRKASTKNSDNSSKTAAASDGPVATTTTRRHSAKWQARFVQEEDSANKRSKLSAEAKTEAKTATKAKTKAKTKTKTKTKTTAKTKASDKRNFTSKVKGKGKSVAKSPSKPRLVADEDVEKRRQENLFQCAKELLRNKIAAAALLQQSGTPSISVPPAAAAASAASDTRPESCNILGYDNIAKNMSRINLVREARNIGLLNVTLFQQAVAKMRNKVQCKPFNDNKEAVLLSLALTATEKELADFLQYDSALFMSPDPIRAIGYLDLSKDAVNGTGSEIPGMYEVSATTSDIEALKREYSKYVASPTADPKARAHFQSQLQMLQRTLNPPETLTESYGGESNTPKDRCGKHAAGTSGTALGAPVLGFLKTLPKFTIVAYMVADLAEVTELMRIFPTLTALQARGIVEIARNVLRLHDHKEGGLCTAIPGGKEICGAGGGHFGDRCAGIRSSGAISVLQAAKSLLGIDTPFLYVKKEIWDAAYYISSERLAALFFTHLELAGFGQRHNVDDLEVTLAQAQASHSGVAGQSLSLSLTLSLSLSLPLLSSPLPLCSALLCSAMLCSPSISHTSHTPLPTSPVTSHSTGMLSSDEERRKAAGPDPAARAAVERDIQRSSDKKAAGGAFFLVALDLCPTHLPRLVVLHVFACPDGHHWRPVPPIALCFCQNFCP